MTFNGKKLACLEARNEAAIEVIRSIGASLKATGRMPTASENRAIDRAMAEESELRIAIQHEKAIAAFHGPRYS